MVTFLFQWIGKASLMRAFIMQKYMQTSKVKKINQPGTARVGGKVHVTVPSQTLAKKKADALGSSQQEVWCSN